MTPTRTETLKFRASLNAAGVARHKELLAALMGSREHLDGVAEGDTYHASYSVNLEYFSGVESKLKAFATILEDPEVVSKTSIEELKFGTSILVDVVTQITKIRDRLALREAVDLALFPPAPAPAPTSRWRRFLSRIRCHASPI